jgi:flagellar FliL protein
MATEATVSPEEKPGKKRRKWLKILLLLLLFFVLAGGGGLAYIVFVDDAPPPAPGAKKAKPTEAPKALMPLEPFLVNLADKETRRYLKLKLELEVDSEKSIKELEKSLPRLRDALILLFSSKNYAEIASAEGKQQLKAEVLKRLAPLPGGNKISGAYFTEFIAQ